MSLSNLFPFYESLTWTLNGRKHAVELYGQPDGPLLVLCHGEWLNQSVFDSSRMSLSEFFVVSYDLVGHGASEKLDREDAYTIEAFARDFAALLVRLAQRTSLDGWRFLGMGALAPLILRSYCQHPGAIAPDTVFHFPYPEPGYGALLQESLARGEEHLVEALATHISLETHYRRSQLIEIMREVPLPASRALLRQLVAAPSLAGCAEPRAAFKIRDLGDVLAFDSLERQALWRARVCERGRMQGMHML